MGLRSSVRKSLSACSSRGSFFRLHGMVAWRGLHGSRRRGQSMTNSGSGQPETKLQGRPIRIVLTAVGSLGDLHPYIAIALGLKARGHEAVVATGACYQKKVEALGLGFRAVRPDSNFVTDPAVMPRFMHPRWGTFPGCCGNSSSPGPSGVLRGHDGSGGRGRPAGLAYDHLRHSTRVRRQRASRGPSFDHHTIRCLLGADRR